MKTQILSILKQYQIKNAELNKIFDIDNPSQEWKDKYTKLNNDTSKSLSQFGLTQNTIESLLLVAGIVTEYHIQLILSQQH